MWSIHTWHRAQLTDARRGYDEKLCVLACVAASVLSLSLEKKEKDIEIA